MLKGMIQGDKDIEAETVSGRKDGLAALGWTQLQSFVSWAWPT